MNKDNEKHFGLRVDGDILAKFRYVCGYVGRSANSQFIQLMLKSISDYEKEQGKIALNEISKGVKTPVAEGLPPTPTGVLSFPYLYPPFFCPGAGLTAPLLTVRGS